MQNIGVDIIEVSRIEQSIKRWGERFLNRVYTERELEMYHRTASLAARFAAKEAVMKTLNAANFGVGYREIEVLSDANDRPVVTLYGRAQVLALRHGISRLAVSLSHCREYAVAMAIGESKSPE